MADLELVFNEESGVWEERPEPYITIEIETEEDFEYLKSAVEFYKNRAKYAEIVHGHWIPIPKHENKRCSVCNTVFSDFTLGYYCPKCGAKMDGDGNGQ